MSDTGYNGWSNYETWNVNLWLSNDEGLYDMTNEFARYSTPVMLANDISYMVDEIAKESGTFGDIDYSDLRMVDYQEIANAWMEDSE